MLLLTYRYVRRNPLLLGGLAILLALFLFWAIGSLIVSPEETRPLAAMPRQRPSMEYPLGTDEVGRNIFAVMVSGTALTLRIGLIAGAVGLAIGALVAFLAGYYGGVVDTVIRGTVDTLQTVPGLLILIIIAASVRSGLSVDQMALIIATLAWITPARTIRAQVLTLRERTYIDIARQSGMSGVGDYLQGTYAESHALHGSQLRPGGCRRDSGVDRPRGSWTWSFGVADPWDDHLLEHLLRVPSAWLVVVVDAADHNHRPAIRRPVPGHGRAR